MTPNPIRSCLGCGQEDDHPRHQVVIPPDMTSVYWHYDCHAQVTKCLDCIPIAQAADGRTGDDLRTFIMEGKVNG